MKTSAMLAAVLAAIAAITSGVSASVVAQPEAIVALQEGTHFEHFTNWLQEHKPKYLSDIDETAKRFKIFSKNLDYIREHNNLGKTYWLGLTNLVDLTPEEYRTFYLNPELKNAEQTSTRGFSHANVKAADKIDWRTKGAVTPVKNQGSCGSCWAFSSTGSMEGINAIKNGNLTSLSEEQLVDCDTVDMGCRGGIMDNAFKYVINNKGIDSEEDYPYKWIHLFDRCQKDKESEHVVSIDDFEDVPAGNKEALLQALTAQPVSIAIEADHSIFQMYSGGVITGDTCGANLDHGVLAVGFDTTADTPYWIVKSSWGAQWGEQGYVRLGLNVTDTNGECGILKHAVYPIIN